METVADAVAHAENGKLEGLPQEIQELLYSYFQAFASLYGIAPLYRLLSTVQKQNPELELTEEQFLAFVDGMSREDQDERHFWVVGAEDIDQDVSQKTPPLRREVVSEYLYIVDDFELYEELKTEQADKPYYIPPKEELLKYADDRYHETPPEYWALGKFLKERMKLQDVDDVLDDLWLIASMDPPEAEEVCNELIRLGGKKCLQSKAVLREFLTLYLDMYNHTRMNVHRGFTPLEIGKGWRLGRMSSTLEDVYLPEGAEIWPPEADKLREAAKPKKVGRNDPCPCGSGKKYKKCCGR